MDNEALADEKVVEQVQELAMRCVTAVEQAHTSSNTTKIRLVANILYNFWIETAAMTEALCQENGEYAEAALRQSGKVDAGEVVAWRWRFFNNKKVWSDWFITKTKRQAEYESRTYLAAEFEPLYAHPAEPASDGAVERVAQKLANADLDGPEPDDYWHHLARAALSTLRTYPRGLEDAGPWGAGTTDDGRVFLQSDDFTHDVRLYVNGDFSNQAQAMEYAENLATSLSSEAGNGGS